jgi:predicted O-methyltransferase YrrM
MTQELWTQVDEYLSSLVIGPDEALEATVRSSTAAGLPSIQVTPLQGKFLHLLARAVKAQRVLEIGTLGGYSSIWLARAIAPGGRLTTLELNPRHVEVARANIARAGLSSVIEVVPGPALETLARMVSSHAAPFDLVFIDADKPSTAEYLRWAEKLSRIGTVIVVDNVVREGAIVDPSSPDPSVVGIRRFLGELATDTSVSGTVIQTVSEKKHDGFALIVVDRPG